MLDTRLVKAPMDAGGLILPFVGAVRLLVAGLVWNHVILSNLEDKCGFSMVTMLFRFVHPNDAGWPRQDVDASEVTAAAGKVAICQDARGRRQIVSIGLKLVRAALRPVASFRTVCSHEGVHTTSHRELHPSCDALCDAGGRMRLI